MILKGSRAAEPIEHLVVGEELTTCTHCGTRTAIAVIEPRPGCQLYNEVCLYCEQRFEVESADDDDDPERIDCAHCGDDTHIEDTAMTDAGLVCSDCDIGMKSKWAPHIYYKDFGKF